MPGDAEEASVSHGGGDAPADDNAASGRNAVKKARQFDLQGMFDSARATAMERSKAALEARALEQSEQSDSSRHSVTGSSGVGKQPSAPVTTDDDDDDDFIGPAIPAALLAAHTSQASTSSQAGSSDAAVGSGPAGKASDDDDEYVDAVLSVDKMMPTACEASFRHGSKAVSAIGLDPQGARFSTGGHDYIAKLYEFQTMDSSLRPYREVQPLECHLITSVSYSSNGENLLVTAACAVAKLFDRKGTEWAETTKGDPYLHDAANTKGHTAAINGSMWHPFIKDQFLTCSDDGTMRIWSTADWKEVTKNINTQKTIIKVKSAQGKRAAPTACAWSRDAKLVACGTDEGSLLLWRTGRVYVTPSMNVRKAHGGRVTSICMGDDLHSVLTRGFDDTVKLWDLRQLKTPVHVRNDLANSYDSTGCCFSARGDLCVTGTTPRKNDDGKLVFLSKSTFKPVYEITYPSQGVVSSVWHPKINQIFVGLTSGEVKCYYDPQLSVRGAMLCVDKPVRRNKRSEVIKEELIVAPLSMPMFNARHEDEDEKEVAGWRLKKLLRMQARPADWRHPPEPAERPLKGSSEGGRMQEHCGSYHSYVLRQLGVAKNKSLREDVDVRASILRHAGEAEKESLFFGNVYKRNQPHAVFQEKTTEEPVKDELEPVFKKTRVIE